MSKTKQNPSPIIQLENLKNAIERVRQVQPDPAPEVPQVEEPKEVAAQTSKTFMIVGLGNPGEKYANTRHNVGFMLADRLAERLGVRFTRIQNRALVTDGRHGLHRLILVKPQTYMNESGQAVGPLARFYKVHQRDLLVVYDDMDIPLGAIRIRPKGGSGGQKGMISIIEKLGNQMEFPRLRLGLGRPPGRMDPPAYLLQNFSRDERQVFDKVLDDAVEAVFVYVTDGLTTAMNQFNGMTGTE